MNVNNSDYNVTYNLQSAWNTGCIMEITISNTSDENIEDWSMKMDFPYTIQNIWRSKITAQEGNTYSLKNLEYNSIIRPGATETFGMQVAYPENSMVKYPTGIILSQYKKDKWYLDFDKEWNRTMIHADSDEFVTAANKNKGKIKIEMLDSGIDYSSNINVIEQEDFTEEYDDMSILFSDLSGHGTAVAGILGSSAAADSETFDYDNEYMNKVMNEKIDGVNPYVDLYCARILNDENETTVSKLVKGIEWAIEKNVNIINISCGVSSNSSKLHEAVKKAHQKGILIIAAAGDSTGIKYPAKYPEVMAVGAVKCNGEPSADSPQGSEIDVVAPGEDVTSYGPFGMVTNFSGTSMATPHVTALASVLWQQDPSKDVTFIRNLIKATARPLGDKQKYGEGLIDCSYALSQFNTYSEKVQSEEGRNLLSVIKEDDNVVKTNDSEVVKYDDEVVRGYWRGEQHTKFTQGMDIIKDGAIWPDNLLSGIKGMSDYPLFHGYYDADYIKAYKTITWVASKMHKNGEIPKKRNGFEKNIIDELKVATENGFLEYELKTKEDKALFIYGIAMHGVSDIFAHSTKGVRWKKIDKSKEKKKTASIKTMLKKWKTLKHGKRGKDGKWDKNRNFADDVSYLKLRVKSANDVTANMLATCIENKEKGSISIFKDVKYYAAKAKAQKYKKKKKKKLYLRNSYGIIKLSKYLKPGKSKKLKKVVNCISNDNVKTVFKNW